MILAFSYDEEVGCKGVPSLIEALLAALPRPAACLVGEPTHDAAGRRPQGEGRLSLHRRAAAKAIPPCRRLGANAVVAAARIIAEIAAMGERFAAEGPFIEGFDPPHHTAGVGRIEGGGQLNIIPRRCSFEFEFRTLPDDDPHALRRARCERFARERGAAGLAGDRTRGRRSSSRRCWPIPG